MLLTAVPVVLTGAGSYHIVDNLGIYTITGSSDTNISDPSVPRSQALFGLMLQIQGGGGTVNLHTTAGTILLDNDPGVDGATTNITADNNTHIFADAFPPMGTTPSPT